MLSLTQIVLIGLTSFVVSSNSAVLEVHATNTALQTVFPSSLGASLLAAATTIAAGVTFDGGMKKNDHSGNTCNDQAEGGDSDAIFVLKDGAVLSTIFIGPNNGEGVHCLGTYTLNNVWWVAVCEDAATFKQTSGTSYVNGGGSKSATENILQHNGGGAVVVKSFFADTFEKAYIIKVVGIVIRSLSTLLHLRIFMGVWLPVSIQIMMLSSLDVFEFYLSGNIEIVVDEVAITNSRVRDSSICYKYTEHDDGGELVKTSSGADGTYCVTSGTTTSGCYIGETSQSGMWRSGWIGVRVQWFARESKKKVSQEE